MDTQPVKTAIISAKDALALLIADTFAAGQRDRRHFNGLGTLARAGASLDQALTHLDSAVARVAPRSAKE
jgi:hypothetical protein